MISVVICQQQSTPTKSPQKTKLIPPKISSHVVLIVVNGLGADLLIAQHKHLPKLNGQISQGTSAHIVEGVYPSLTQTAQASIATGMLPADHGVFTDNEATKLLELNAAFNLKAKKNASIWESATNAGLSVAAIGYELTRGATINFNFPDFPDQTKQLANGNKKRNNDLYKSIMESDSQRTQKACELIKEAQPNLLLINFVALEFALNQFGATSKEVSETLAKLDEWIDQIQAATTTAKIHLQTTFVIVSDSGRADIETEFNPNVTLAKKGWLTVDAQGKITEWKALAIPLGGAAAIFLKNQADEKSVEALFKEIHQKPDSPIWRIFNRQEISRFGTLPQATLMLDAAPGYSFGRGTKGSATVKSQQKTTAGYSPQRAEMRPVFFAFGNGIKTKKTLSFMRITDVAPTVARILGIMHGASRGRVLTEILQP